MRTGERRAAGRRPVACLWVTTAATWFLALVAPACRSLPAPPPHIVREQIVATITDPELRYTIALGRPGSCGDSCEVFDDRCPAYGALRDQGWVTTACMDGRVEVALTAAGRDLFHVDAEPTAERPRCLGAVVLARWEWVGIADIRPARDGWAHVTYRWRYAPTEAGRRFIERGFPEPPLGDRDSLALAPLDDAVEATVSFLLRDGRWQLLSPPGGSSGGVYVH